MKEITIVKDTLENMYVVVDKYGSVDFTTISFQRNWSIKYFSVGSKMTWKECYKLGYRCYKMTITFKTQNH